MCKSNSNLLSWYGLKDIDNLARISIENTDEVVVENDQEILNNICIPQNRVIILFIAVRVSTTIERRLSFDALLKRKYGLSCITIAECTVQPFSTVTRKGAVQVLNNHLPLVLKILRKLSYHAFAVYVEEPRIFQLVNIVMQHFVSDTLTQTTLAKCCNASLTNDAFFLHILAGNDGYSVNLFHLIPQFFE